MVHIVQKPFSWYPFGFNSAGMPVYTEYYPDTLRDVYGGKTGYLYVCSWVHSAENPTSINCAYACEQPVPVDSCEEYEDIYKRLLEFEQEGRLILRRYETLGEKSLFFIEKSIEAEIEKYHLKDNPQADYSQFLKQHFPKITTKKRRES